MTPCSQEHACIMKRFMEPQMLLSGEDGLIAMKLQESSMSDLYIQWNGSNLNTLQLHRKQVFSASFDIEIIVLVFGCHSSNNTLAVITGSQLRKRSVTGVYFLWRRCFELMWAAVLHLSQFGYVAGDFCKINTYKKSIIWYYINIIHAFILYVLIVICLCHNL